MTDEDGDRRVRKQVDIRVGFRKRGYRRSKADVRNLSVTGFLIDSGMSLAVGEEVWLNLPGLQSIPATVTRTDGYEAGCAFERPLNDAVFDNLIKHLS
ncbi:PilZ domain-containing protein [Parasphingopyxis sp. CP4]|uniref:PilZ domain-containing protein n=1 Tax=Parasphingopyxis sp. CP4 TaxID=2724527 RepID=UPI0015A2EF1A|nr:PilZ domain-containing protein [Parasphingopyxis sp. CP4]QLC22284.1 PilZ domain-containing protein [Parasphingopyxis sp. CP4]